MRREILNILEARDRHWIAADCQIMSQQETDIRIRAT
jgi:hypothetical protein